MKISFLLWLASILPQPAADQVCLASTVYLEARSESQIGQMAVAEVAMRRRESGRWGSTVCDVVRAPGQFALTTMKDSYSLNNPAAWKKAWTVAGRGAEQRERRAAFGPLERVALAQLAAPVQRKDLLEARACALGDAAHLLDELGGERLDVRQPARRALADLGPRQAGLRFELLAVERDRDGDLVARLLAVLPPALARIGGVDVDERRHRTTTVAWTTR